MENNIIDFSTIKLKKDIGIEFFSFQEIRDFNIAFSKDDMLVDVAVLDLRISIENNEYIPSILVLKKKKKKINVLEGKHIIQAINEVEKYPDNWNTKFIPVMFQ